MSALLLLGGAAGDRFGHRRLLLMGVGLFAAASLLCAAAPGLPWLTGLNSAVARTGGLVSTALLSFILAAQGAALQRLFEVAMLCAAAAALAAAVCAFVWLKPPAPARNP